MGRIHLVSGTVVLAGILLNAGCTKLSNDLPVPTSGLAQIHPAGWNDTTSGSFHGKVLKSQSYNLNTCISCHAKSFEGGISNVSCYKCHTLFPHSPAWGDTSAVGYHGNFLLARQGQLSDCATCHGTSFTGGTSGVSCFGCHISYPHVTGWTDTSSVGFHGKFLKALKWKLNNCTPCHGPALNGGKTGVSCFTCHASYPHADGWADSTMAGFHGNFIRTSTWNMLQCKPCHGSSYTGGRVTISCLTCHTKTNGPENCTTCHGGANAAPPVDLNRNSVRTAHGVGAHQIHLSGSYLADTLQCIECHTVPSSVYQPGHISAAVHAPIHFDGPVGALATAGGTFVPTPAYNSDSLRCSSTFCHGNWRLEKSASQDTFYYSDTVMVGNNYSPLWTGTSSEAVCGSCHGLPPAGHKSKPLSKCGSCHWNKTAWDEIDVNGNILDRTKHMNGMENVFGSEYRFGFPPPFSTVKGRQE